MDSEEKTTQRDRPEKSEEVTAIRPKKNKRTLILSIAIVLLTVSNAGVLVYSLSADDESAVPDIAQQDTNQPQTEQEPVQDDIVQTESINDEELTYETVEWDIAGLSGTAEVPVALSGNVRIGGDLITRSPSPQAVYGFAGNGCKDSTDGEVKSCYWVPFLHKAAENEYDSNLADKAARADQSRYKDYCSVALEDSYAVQVRQDVERYVTLCGHKTEGQTFIDAAVFTKFSFSKDQQISRDQLKDIAKNVLMHVEFGIGPGQCKGPVCAEHVDYETFSLTAVGQEMIKILRSVKYDE